jgi:hypothetical protein
VIRVSGVDRFLPIWLLLRQSVMVLHLSHRLAELVQALS